MTKDKRKVYKLPSSIRVADWNVRVECKNKIWKDEGGNECLGQFIEDRMVLKLFTGVDVQQLRRTLVHEIIHVAFCSSGTSRMLGKDQKLDSYDMNERVCRILEGPLVNIIRENPDLLEFLTSDLGD